MKDYGVLVIKDINHGFIKDIFFLPMENYPFTKFIHGFCESNGYKLKDIVEEDVVRTVRVYVRVN